MLVVKLEKINDLDTALKYKGFEVLVPENAIPEEAGDEVYWFKIEGSRVVDEKIMKLASCLIILNQAPMMYLE